MLLCQKILFILISNNLNLFPQPTYINKWSNYVKNQYSIAYKKNHYIP